MFVILQRDNQFPEPEPESHHEELSRIWGIVFGVAASVLIGLIAWFLVPVLF